MDDRTTNLITVLIAGFALIVSLLAFNESKNANRIAVVSNGIADTANKQSERHHENAQRLNQRLFDLEREFARPTLTLIRVRRIGSSKFVATIQNDGQRHVAIMAVSYQTDRQYGGPMATGISTSAPIENVARTFNIDLSELVTERAPWELSRPLTIDPGAIVNVELTKPPLLSFGEFYLMSSEGISTPLGYFDERVPLPRIGAEP